MIIFENKGLCLARFQEEIYSDAPPFVKKKHISGQHAYFASREALRQSLKNYGILTSSWDDLEIENHHRLKKFPQFFVSLSHTQKIGAAYIAPSNTARSVGIDIEFANRQFNERILKFFVNSDDKFNDPLELWVKKEAAYKAVSPLFPHEKLTLKMITIEHDYFEFKNKTLKSRGEICLNKINSQNPSILLAMAQLY